MKVSKTDRETFLASLREIVEPGDTVYTYLRHVSRSGMMRKIGVYAFTCEDGRPAKRWISFWTAAATGFGFDDKTECVIVHGCGMDTGFEIVYHLGRTLYPDGFGLPMFPPGHESGPHDRSVKTRRPKTRKEAERLAAKGWRAYGRNGDKPGWNSDGGYALSHQWL